MDFLKKVINLPVASTVVLFGGALMLAAKLVPKCMHSEEHYSFPQAPRREKVAHPFGSSPIVLRTCNICGEVKPYSWTEMRFLTKKEWKAYLNSLVPENHNGTAARTAAIV